MDRIQNSDRIIFKVLFKNNRPTNIYHFHEKYLLSPGQISHFINTFSPLKIITFKDWSIELTYKGQKWVLNNRDELFVKNIDMTWRKPNPNYFTNKITPFTPYIPSKTFLLDNLIKGNL